MRRISLAVVLICMVMEVANACRFTVREIGFSTLSRDIYSLVVVDRNADASDAYYQNMRKRLEDSNINLSVLNPTTDADHPYVIQIKGSKIHLPAQVLISPDGRMLELTTNDNISDVVDEILDSPIRQRLRKDFSDVFSVIIQVDGKVEEKNKEVATHIQNDCHRIENIMPYMPKKVKNSPTSMRLSVADFERERILLWSLGIEEQPNEPLAFVLYGRGRIMGEAVKIAEVADGKLYKLMSMIGADCECGLDRKWMLGNQIPLYWPTESRQQLADEVGFDVDNPMILAEMSRILAKETEANIAGEVDYGIEVIDLKSAFKNDVPEISYNKEAETIDQSSNSVVFIVLAVVGMVLATGLFFFYKNRNN